MKKLSKHFKTAIAVTILGGILVHHSVTSPSYSQSTSRIVPTTSPPTNTPKPVYWLILINAFSNLGHSLHKIPMEPMEQCEAQGNIWKDSFDPKNQTYTPLFRSTRSQRQFICLEGK
ncbi:hypothetical protein [Cyanobium usitatum]|uniref:hypothetical protein n=1 Tax=Cyanobium usitatum TaxID=2304190 RepID=UPI002AD50318|nr:hypothetical protein [Cyanobium usitatum]